MPLQCDNWCSNPHRHHSDCSHGQTSGTKYAIITGTEILLWNCWYGRHNKWYDCVNNKCAILTGQRYYSDTVRMNKCINKHQTVAIITGTDILLWDCWCKTDINGRCHRTREVVRNFFDVPDSSVGFLVYNFHSLPVYDVFSVVAWSIMVDLLMVDINLFSHSRAITNYLTCTSFSVIGTDEVNVIRWRKPLPSILYTPWIWKIKVIWFEN